MANPYTNNPWEPPRDPMRSRGPAQDMGDIAWVLTSFEGRIPRRTYWLWTFVVTIAFYIAIIVLSFALGVIAPDIAKDLVNIVVLVMYLPLLWINVALQVKRWHDRDKSGWYVLVGFIPIIGGIWAFIECGCLRGTYGSNIYGADPT